MPRWKELPETIDHRVRQLVVQLRRLKDHSGLSLAALSAKTTYSKSSWERYLNARTLPPRGAVEELARVAGVDPTRLLALREVAEAAQESALPVAAAGAGEPGAEHDGTAPAAPDSAPDTTPGTAPDSAPGTAPDTAPALAPARARVASARVRWAVVVAGAVVVLVAGGLFAVSALSPWQEGEASRDPRTSAHEGEYVPERGRTYDCRVQRHKGRTYAGHSATRRAVLVNNSAGWEVVEAQCLLHEAGFDPGAVDGIYGPNTELAVKRLQSEARIADDGKVGPDTWGVLRG